MPREATPPNLEDAPAGTKPICGYCKKELPTIWHQTRDLGVAEEQVLICPHCRAVLGYGVQHI